jgi:endoglucanase
MALAFFEHLRDLLLETLRRLKEQGIRTPNTLYFVGIVHEEVGLRGAHTTVEAVKPDLRISLEAGIAADHPGGRPDWAQERLGAGPVIYLADAAMLVNLKLRDFIERVAAENHIPLQTEVTAGGSEDSAEMQRFGAGSRQSISLWLPAICTPTPVSSTEPTSIVRSTYW